VKERIYPPDCKCKPLALGQVTFFDNEQKREVTHKIAVRSIRRRDCPVHAPANDRCMGKYLVRMVINA
jgi:hypothetical protein